MTAALKARPGSERSVNRDRRPLAANAIVKKGWVAVCKADGFFAPATGTAGEVVVGRFYEDVDNTGGANGAKLADVQYGRERWLWLYENDGANPVLAAHRENLCSAVDNQTFRAYVAGRADAIVYDVTSEGVWVEIRNAAAVVVP